jgi:hypothetical protein
VVRETVPRAFDGLFGDGIVFWNGTGSVRLSLVDANARAGIANFSSAVALEGNTLTCNPIPLNLDETEGPAAFDDRGGNSCSCGGEAALCSILQAKLEPPEPL